MHLGDLDQFTGSHSGTPQAYEAQHVIQHVVQQFTASSLICAFSFSSTYINRINSFKMASNASRFEHLDQIGQDVFYISRQTPKTSSQPNLIVLCTWLGGATPSRVQKYVDGYMLLYKDSSILLITARFVEMTALPFTVIRARLAPARDVILQLINTSSKPDMLWHIFSHGGCNTAIQLLHSLRVDNSVAIGQHLKGVMFDCCPGDATFENAYRAATYSLPRDQLSNTAGRIILYPIVGFIDVLQKLGLMSSVRELRNELNQPSLFGTSAKRLYLYSKDDGVVRWQEVETHMEEARQSLGPSTSIEGVSFPNSPHCALVRDHGPRYWDTIKNFYDKEHTSTDNTAKPPRQSKL